MNHRKHQRHTAGLYGSFWGTPGGGRHRELSESMRDELQAQEWAAQDKAAGITRPAASTKRN